MIFFSGPPVRPLASSTQYLSVAGHWGVGTEEGQTLFFVKKTPGYDITRPLYMYFHIDLTLSPQQLAQPTTYKDAPPRLRAIANIARIALQRRDILQFSAPTNQGHLHADDDQ